MSDYAIGDIQGCYDEFLQLLSLIGFNPGKDNLYFVGDLVNRGKGSLAMMRWLYNHSYCATSVLGNHEIYLLLRYYNLCKSDFDDTLDGILFAQDAKKLIEFVQEMPLLDEYDDNTLLVHAGVYPLLDYKVFLHLSECMQYALKENASSFLEDLCKYKVSSWDPDAPLIYQICFAVGSCTRMRYLYKDNYHLNFRYKDIVDDIDVIPWYDVPSKIDKFIVFGHWASLGLFKSSNCICIDSGCIWGNSLTAVDLQTLKIIEYKK